MKSIITLGLTVLLLGNIQKVESKENYDAKSYELKSYGRDGQDGGGDDIAS